MSERVRPIIVFGLTSYVGGFLLFALRQRGIPVLGVTRSKTKARLLLSPQTSEDSIVTYEELDGISVRPLAVVNLSYPRRTSADRALLETKALVDAVTRIADRGAQHLIQVSTLAVFGDGLEREPVMAPVRWRPASAPLETKIFAENMMRKAARRSPWGLTILRLGHVVGPASPLWVARPAEIALFQGGFGTYPIDGFSNATDVRNVADYIRHVASGDPQELGPGVRFDHLAEFSEHRWHELLEVISSVIGVPYPPEHASGDREMTLSTTSIRRNSVLRLVRLYHSSAIGAYVRRLSAFPILSRMFRRVRETAWTSPEAPARTTTGAHPILRSVFGCQRQFHTHVLDSWRAPIPWDTCLGDIADWLRYADFPLLQGVSASDRWGHSPRRGLTP